jgi:hypothetical protein
MTAENNTLISKRLLSKINDLEVINDANHITFENEKDAERLNCLMAICGDFMIDELIKIQKEVENLEFSHGGKLDEK